MNVDRARDRFDVALFILCAFPPGVMAAYTIDAIRTGVDVYLNFGVFLFATFVAIVAARDVVD